MSSLSSPARLTWSIVTSSDDQHHHHHDVSPSVSYPRWAVLPSQTIARSGHIKTLPGRVMHHTERQIVRPSSTLSDQQGRSRGADSRPLLGSPQSWVSFPNGYCHTDLAGPNHNLSHKEIYRLFTEKNMIKCCWDISLLIQFDVKSHLTSRFLTGKVDYADYLYHYTPDWVE